MTKLLILKTESALFQVSVCFCNGDFLCLERGYFTVVPASSPVHKEKGDSGSEAGMTVIKK